MIIRRNSSLTGKIHEMEIPVTEDQMNLWRSGVPIQNAMPNLTPGQREFIKTGITEQEWDTYLP
jgi:hypothetical protein